MSSKVHALNANDVVALAGDVTAVSQSVTNLSEGAMLKSTYLDGGKIKSEYLPSYVDDVLEYANLTQLPATGETGKIYVTTATNKTYRWAGTRYVEISASEGAATQLPAGSTYDFSTMKGVITAVKDIVLEMGGTVNNFPSMT